MGLPAPFAAYVAAWSAFCLAALALATRDRARLAPEASAYLRFLCVPWKPALFLPALLFVTFAGRFAWDDSWDVVTGAGMSLLTFATAPWAVGAACRAALGLRPRRDLVLAAAALLFSASWFYDGYLLWRDGSYHPLWLPNLLVSPFLYVAGGLLWNLETDGAGRPTLAFAREGWPRPQGAPSYKALLPWTLPFVAFAAGILLFSVEWRI